MDSQNPNDQRSARGLMGLRRGLWQQSSKRIGLKLILWTVLGALLIVVNGGFRVLYSSNQHFEFIYGLAQAGYGELASDWLATSSNPWIAFSYLVSWTYSFLNERFFHLYQAFLAAVYLYSLAEIGDHLFGLRRRRILYAFFVALLVITHADYWPGYFESLLYGGVANQRMEIQVLIPNTFAALLFLSVLLHLRGKRTLSLLAIAVSCYFHPAYLITGTAMTAAFLARDYYDQRNLKRMFLLGGAMLLLVTPLVIQQFRLGTGLTPSETQQANFILGSIRIPFHTHVEEWLDNRVTVKVLIVAAALLAIRKKDLSWELAILFGFTAIPTVVLYLRPSNLFGLLSPWRTSVILMPLASVLLQAYLVDHFFDQPGKDHARLRWPLMVTSGAVALMVLAAGVRSQLLWVELFEERYYQPVLSFIRDNQRPDDLYLIPPYDHALNAFRLDTGMPIVANWEIHPMPRPEVLEWYRRVGDAAAFYDSGGPPRCEILETLVSDYQITRVVMPAGDKLDCLEAVWIFADQDYAIYQLTQ